MIFAYFTENGVEKMRMRILNIFNKNEVTQQVYTGLDSLSVSEGVLRL